MFVVFDLDNTLSDTLHRNHFITENMPKKWREFYLECYKDPIQKHAKNVLMALYIAGHHIEIWSGRSDLVRDMTIDWFDKHDIWHMISALRMRREGDYCSDVMLKRAWLKACTTDGVMKPPDLVFDDRNRVVEMYRQHNIPCYQVVAGDF